MSQDEQKKKLGQIIAKTWDDDGFKKKLIANPGETFKEEGLEMPSDVEVRVVEDSDKVVYLVLPPNPSTDELTDDQMERISGAGGCCMIFGSWDAAH